jgi:aryl carrier-like protein
MVPSAFTTLEALPLSANGKVDRSALAAVASDGAGPAGAAPRHRAPRNDVEERLATIWADGLGVERVGVEDGFLELGGDSIKAIQVLTRAREVGIELTVRQLFERQTVALLAETAKIADHPEAGDEVGETEAFSVGDLDVEELEGLAEEVGG